MSKSENDDFLPALRALDQEMNQAAAGQSKRTLSAVQLASLAKARTRRKMATAGTTMAIAVLAVWFVVGANGVNGTKDHQTASHLDVGEDLTSQLAIQIEEMNHELASLRALQSETEQFLIEIRRKDASPTWKDPAQDASTKALFYANYLLENGADLQFVRRELESVTRTFPDTVGASEAAKLLIELASDQKSDPLRESSLRLQRSRVPLNQIAKDF